MLVGPRVRLAILVGTLVAAAVAIYVFDVIEPREVRTWTESFGPLAPVAFVLIAGALGALLVPGALLAAASGVLFGAVVGALVSVSAAVCTSVIAVLTARHSGAEHGMREISGERLNRLRGAVERHGVLTVAIQRLLPGVPDGPMSHAFAVLGVRIRDIVLGTLLGAWPRALSYAAVGASLENPKSPLAVFGVAGLVVTGIVGAAVGHRALRKTRPAVSDPRPPRRAGSS
jgi:uncharacterized membrane protein YdjX (TVP38/TMEM64 family)